jgi:hypothetical protein
MDSVIMNMESCQKGQEYWADVAVRALRRCEGQGRTARVVGMRVLAVLSGLVNAVCLLSEVSLVWDAKYSAFNMLSHVPMHKMVGMLLSAVILAYLLGLGSWSLTRLGVGEYYRFRKGTASVDTLLWFASFVARLAPTIAFEYLQQIEAKQAEFLAVMKFVDVFEMVGNGLRVAVPIVFMTFLLLFAFDIPDRVIKCCCGAERGGFDLDTIVLGSAEDIRRAEAHFKEMRPAEKEKVERLRLLDGPRAEDTTGSALGTIGHSLVEPTDF